MGASDGVDSATWADPPSFVRKNKIARAQFGEEGARDPTGHGLVRRVHVIPRPAGGRGSCLFRSDGQGPRGRVGDCFLFSLEGGPGGFLFSGGRWLAILGRPAAH